MKRFSLFLLTVFSAIVLVASPADQTIGGVRYTYNSAAETYVVAGYDAGSGLSALTVESKLRVEGNSYTVYAVADGAFKDCTAITSLTLPLTLRTIGNNAFEGCTSLTSIRIPGNVSKIGVAAFKGCTAITTVVFDGRPTEILGTGDDAAFAGVGTMLSPVVLQVPAAIYVAKIYKNGANWGGYFVTAPIIPVATQTIQGVVYKYKENIRNDAFGVDLEQPCYVVDGYDASVADARADVFIPKIVSGLPVLAIYSLSNAAIRSIEVDTLYSYTVKGQDYPLIMNIENIKEIAELPENLAFKGLGSKAEPVDFFVPTLDDAMNIIFNFAFQVGTDNGGYLNVWGRQHKEKGVVYNYNRNAGYYTADAFDVESAVASGDGSYKLEIIGELKDIFEVKKVSENAFNAVFGTENYNPEVAKINKLVIPDMVETISNYAFRGLANVDSVVIPASVKTIGSGAFLSLGSNNQGSQVVTLVGSPTFDGANIFLGVGRADKKATILCKKEDVEKYKKLMEGETFFNGYFNIEGNTRRLTLTSPDESILELTGSGDYNYMEPTEIKATIKNEGYEFAGWSDGVKSATRTISLDRDSTLTASFTVRQFEITTSVNNPAMGTAEGDGTYDFGEAVTLTASPADGYHFVNWNADDKLTDASLDIVVPLGGGNYEAVFAPNKYTITLATNYPEKCTVSGGGTYDYLSKVTINTTGSDGYEFVEWSDGVTAQQREIEVPKGGLTLTASYRLLGQYTVSALCDATMGSTTGSQSGFEHTVVHLTATPNAGYKFIRWSDDITDAERDVTIGKSNITLTAIFEPIDYVISANVNDAEMGSVVGSGLGYQAYNSSVTIEAKANYGYHFVEWEDGSTDAVRTIVVPLNGGTFTATFAIDMFTLVAEAEDSEMGRVTGAGEYPYGSVVEIEAVANDGYTFIGWTDGRKTAKRTITLEINGDSYVARFEPLDYEVKTAVNNKAMGQVEGASIYPYNKEITLTATPSEGYHFARWEDGSTDAVRTLRVPLGGGTFTATFEANEYEITADVEPAKSGTVSGVGTYPYRTRVTLTAVANEGFTFKHWKDNESTKTSRTITMPINGFSFVAVFTPDQYEVKTSSNNSSWGTTSGNGVFDYMSKTVIKAQPKEGYRFVMWEDGSISAERTITVPLGGATYNAIFAAETFHVEVVSSDLAKGTTKGTGDYENGQQVEIEAVANDGYVFTQWADGNKDAKRTVTVDGDVTYTAYFDYMQYDITAVAQDPAMGSVQGGGTYSYLDEVKLTAQAAEGYHFVEWSDGSAEAERTIVVAVGGGTYTAIFAPNKYAITVDVDPASAGRGTVEGTGEYDFNSPVEIRAIAATGYHFVEWNDGNNDATRTITVPLGGATYVATFTANSYTVTALSADETMGSVSGSGEYEYLSDATLVATPATGYHFVAWSDGVETAERTIKVEDNITLTATFAPNDYTLTLSVEGEGTVMGAGTYKYGEQVEISAQAAEGYKFVGWSDDVTDAVRTITIEGDLELTARFEQITYTLTLLSSDEQMGQVSGAGTYPVNTEVEIEAVAFEHFRFVSWSDGNTEAKRTIVLTADLTLTAEFEVDDTALRNNKFDGEVSVIGREITVMLNQKHDVVVFAADGKCVAAEQNTQNMSVVVPQAGVYLVGIGTSVMRVAVY